MILVFKLQGFDAVNWHSTVDETSGSVTFAYHAVDGEEGYPGDLNVFAKYRCRHLLQITLKKVSKITDERRSPLFIWFGSLLVN